MSTSKDLNLSAVSQNLDNSNILFIYVRIPKEFHKEFQKIPIEFQKNSKRILQFPMNSTKNPRSPKRILKTFPKNSTKNSQIVLQRIPQRIIKELIPKEFPKYSQNFENIQFPTSHLEAENPFELIDEQV